MKEHGVMGARLTRGIDVWLKRVDYFVWDKLYHKETFGTGSNHEGIGEGLENFHVGPSQGEVGSAVSSNGEYHVSKNFIFWNTHCTGPVGTSFTLTCEDWYADERLVSETKTISLDKGNTLPHFISQRGEFEIISPGLNLHENDNITATEFVQSWTSYWEPHRELELSTAIVVSAGRTIETEQYISGAKDESNLYCYTQVEDSRLEYYSGYPWKKSGQFANQEEWETYLRRFAVMYPRATKSTILIK